MTLEVARVHSLDKPMGRCGREHSPPWLPSVWQAVPQVRACLVFGCRTSTGYQPRKNVFIVSPLCQVRPVLQPSRTTDSSLQGWADWRQTRQLGQSRAWIQQDEAGANADVKDFCSQQCCFKGPCSLHMALTTPGAESGPHHCRKYAAFSLEAEVGERNGCLEPSPFLFKPGSCRYPSRQPASQLC